MLKPKVYRFPSDLKSASQFISEQIKQPVKIRRVIHGLTFELNGELMFRWHGSYTMENGFVGNRLFRIMDDGSEILALNACDIRQNAALDSALIMDEFHYAQKNGEKITRHTAIRRARQNVYDSVDLSAMDLMEYMPDIFRAVLGTARMTLTDDSMRWMQGNGCKPREAGLIEKSKRNLKGSK